MLHDEPFGGLAETIDALVPDTERLPVRAESIAIDMPLEFYVRVDDDDAISIESTAPTQRIVTSILPVFHRVRLQLSVDEVEDSSIGGT